MYNAYIDGLFKGRDPEKALAIFERMKRENCEPTAETYTMVINIYGKVIHYDSVHLPHIFVVMSYCNLFSVWEF